ncbi:MAG: FprA family A-type flavoprotein [Firmicutes bacterium]|nr:FprA family A-type flavoprotein [Bacillota bacterium]
MKNTVNIKENIYWVGCNDRKIDLFENVYPLTSGVSYNSYIVKDKENVLLDAVDATVTEKFLENIEDALNGETLSHIIVNHMEPDHCAGLKAVALKYPQAKIHGTAKTLQMIGQFFDLDVTDRFEAKKEGDSLVTGENTFKFYTAPLVHWPEVMVTYLENQKTLFSADAFGTFGALEGNIFADESCFDFSEARRYYANIVGKYGPQVTNLLKKAGGLDIELICPLHGPVWRKDIAEFVNKYSLWSSYTPEEKAVVIIYGSIYGHTEEAAEILAFKLSERGVKNIKLYDSSRTDVSYLVAESFRASNIVIASITYNNEIFSKVENYLTDIAEHNLAGRVFSIIENGSWGPMAAKKITERIESLKNCSITEGTLTLRSSLKEENLSGLDTLADNIVESLK